VEINIALSTPPSGIQQQAYIVFETQKLKLVKNLIKDTTMRSILIFCGTKLQVKQLTRELKKINQQVAEIHSDLDQEVREQVMNRFKSRQVQVLVATDIVSRGIDVEDIDMVVNYSVPHDAEDYIHRIGRTARAAAQGMAVTLVGEAEQRKFAAIEKLLGKVVPKAKVPDDLGETPLFRPDKIARVHKSGQRFVHRSKRRKEN
jgi:ATP-dependent RNA helicase RhlE